MVWVVALCLLVLIEKLLYPNEAIMANMIGIVAGNDNLFESYFKNDPKILLNALMKAGVEL